MPPGVEIFKESRREERTKRLGTESGGEGIRLERATALKKKEKERKRILLFRYRVERAQDARLEKMTFLSR